MDKQISYNPVLIVTALKSEAKPLIEHYGLKSDTESQFRVYQKNSITLLICGLGKQKASKSLTSFLKEYPDEYLLVNVGIAGGNPKTTKIGELFVIHKITDKNSEREWFPDILLKHGLKTSELTTVDTAVTNGSAGFKNLVDMEASGLLEAAIKYIPPHRMVFLKIVSDSMTESEFSEIDVTALVQTQLSEIERIIQIYKNAKLWNSPILNDAELEKLASGIKTMKLTATQVEELKILTEGKKIKSGDLTDLWPKMEFQSQSKKERNDRFEQIKQFLSS